MKICASIINATIDERSQAMAGWQRLLHCVGPANLAAQRQKLRKLGKGWIIYIRDRMIEEAWFIIQPVKIVV